MKTYISMLRGINVGGHKSIKMEDLRELYEGLGFGNVRSYVQSGNVLFDSEELDRWKLSSMIEAQIEEVFGFYVPAFIREPHDLARVLEANPFLPTTEDTNTLYVAFLYVDLDPESAEKLARPTNETADFRLGQDEIFLYYPDGAGKSKLTTTYLEQKLNVQATTRNWNTVNKLVEMGGINA
jgi:uncharacterized protein (DUF1697 family)